LHGGKLYVIWSGKTLKKYQCWVGTQFGGLELRTPGFNSQLVKTEPKSGLIFGTGLELEVRGFGFFPKNQNQMGTRILGFARSETRSWIFFYKRKRTSTRG
jgi:hypothetical protein